MGCLCSAPRVGFVPDWKLNGQLPDPKVDGVLFLLETQQCLLFSVIWVLLLIKFLSVRGLIDAEVVKMIRHIQLCLVYHEAVNLLSRHRTLVTFI